MKLSIFSGNVLPLIFTAVAFSSSFAQERLTLKDCLGYATANNHELKVSGYNVVIANKKVSEQTGNYLPQVNATGTFDDNLALSTQLLPAEMTGGTPGTYIAVKFGTKYSVNGGLSVTQKIFDAGTLLQIKTAKLNLGISKLDQQQTDLNVAYNISLSFYQSLVIQMQLEGLKSTMVSSEKSLNSIELKFRNGMAKKVDVNKIKVSYNNTKSQMEQAKLNYAQSLNVLKFNMGMPIDSVLVLAESSASEDYEVFIRDAIGNFRNEDNIDYQLKKTNVAVMQLDRNTKRSAFYPILSFYGNYNHNAMRQEFTFFSSGSAWYASSGIGLKLSIPIFDGLQRTSRLAQSELGIKIARENLITAEQSIRLEIFNDEVQYKNALANIEREMENLELAKGVYSDTQQEYQQGICSTVDVVQSESSYLVAQSTYYNKLLKLYLARIDLEKSKGSLLSFINNLK